MRAQCHCIYSDLGHSDTKQAFIAKRQHVSPPIASWYLEKRVAVQAWTVP